MAATGGAAVPTPFHGRRAATKMVEHHVLLFWSGAKTFSKEQLPSVLGGTGAGLAQGVPLRAVLVEMELKGSCAVSDQGSHPCWLFRRLLGIQGEQQVLA